MQSQAAIVVLGLIGILPCRAVTAQVCPDLNADGMVNVTDLTQVVLAWGPCEGCPADLDGSGSVDVNDLTAVILGWGPCPTACPEWLPTFGGQPGTNDSILALAVYDDGSDLGPALYAAGKFTTAGGVSASKIARWTGSTWSPLGTGMNHDVFTLAVHDDGTGPALYAGGEFTIAGGMNGVLRIARWNGYAWSAVGSGIQGAVRALAVHDDGSGGGPALYAGGQFAIAGSANANSIARWDGLSWSALGSGMNDAVSALAVHDDGTGPALYAGGEFTTAGGMSASYIARWDGSSWSPLANGVNGPVRVLSAFDDGSGAGPSLYAGGEFTTAGDVDADYIARWDGSWSPLASGVDHWVRTLAAYDDGLGGGPALYVGGSFTMVGGAEANRIARWDGSSWSPLGAGTSGSVQALAVYDDGSGTGPALYPAGFFSMAGELVVQRIARWDGSAWSALQLGMDDWVESLAVHEDGSGAGPALYAGGEFTTASGASANHVARWDGTSWSQLGSGMNSDVEALVVHDDGSGGGPALYAGGGFTMAGGVEANRVARWDGLSWSPLGSGMDSSVRDLEVHDDGSGSGPNLYAAGQFMVAGGVEALRIARWDGFAWSPLGTGMLGSVNALASHDDGSGAGPCLYAGGNFTIAGDIVANHIARWDGSSWSPVGGGMDGSVSVLLVFDDGSGSPALYAGGNFTIAGGVGVNHISRWDGSSWSTLASGMNGVVSTLVAHDDGSGTGPDLYAGGSFTIAGQLTANRIARWDGSAWSPLGNGVDNLVRTLIEYAPSPGADASLIAGGRFVVSPAGDSYIARWGCADDR